MIYFKKGYSRLLSSTLLKFGSEKLFLGGGQSCALKDI